MDGRGSLVIVGGTRRRSPGKCSSSLSVLRSQRAIFVTWHRHDDDQRPMRAPLTAKMGPHCLSDKIRKELVHFPF